MQKSNIITEKEIKEWLFLNNRTKNSKTPAPKVPKSVKQVFIGKSKKQYQVQDTKTQISLNSFRRRLSNYKKDHLPKDNSLEFIIKE